MAGTQMQLEDWLDDLCVRFIINLPQEDLSSVARICFQVEEAQWFYEDFIRPLDPSLPSMSLRTFSLRIFQHCPLLASFSAENHTRAFEEFLEYKTRVPVRGAILLNEAMDSTVLVKGWKKGANWSFPRGKINKDEDDLDCAVREVYEETGLDLKAAGLVPTEGKPKYIEISMREQHMRLYVFRNVPMDTVFEPKTRKEISKIQWYKLSELPAFRKKGAQNNDSSAVPNANKFYMVAPFLVPLKKWVVSQKKIEARRAPSGTHTHGQIDEVPFEDDTWTQTDTGTGLPNRTPAIETLEGATQELQRLLKVQPPTQGLQPAPPQPDKGSALLSILQAKSSGPAGLTMQPGTQLPHTPLDNMGGAAPQPTTPHHHHHHQMAPVFQQPPPPTFQLPPNPEQWNVPTGGPRHPQPPNQYPIPQSQQQYGSNQTTLVHPQPLPPQVQRAVFNRSVFQEGTQPVKPAQPSSYAAAQPSGYGGAPGYPTNPQAQFPQPAQHRALPLNGQSMALLNAFKSDSTATHSNENAKQPPHQSYAAMGDPNVNNHAPYGSHQMAGVASGAEVLYPQERAQPSPKELLGSKAAAAPVDTHRSALLGMFRKTESRASTGEASDAQGYLNTGLPAHASGNALNELLASSAAAATMRSRGPSRGSVDVSHQSLPVEGLSLGHRAGQSITPTSQGRSEHMYPYAPEQSIPAGPQNPQPVRILQRGQPKSAYGVGNPAMASPRQALHEIDNSGPGHMSSPSSVPAFMASGGQGSRSGSGADQKRQLLSLFGKQQGPPGGMEAGKDKEAIAELPRSRVASLASGAGDVGGAVSAASSRRGSQTPISPADRSFLLGYLESVTNNASR